MADFAKIFNSEKHGQILIKFDFGDDGPEVRFYYHPDGFGVCSLATTYFDTDGGWREAEDYFERIGIFEAETVVGGMAKNILKLQ